MSARLWGILCAVVVLVADQLSKAWIIQFFQDHFWPVDLLPFLRLVMTWNTGVSFGIFNDGGPWNAWLLSALAGLVSIVLLVWLWRSKNTLICLSLGGIIGGAVGNLIDRIRFGAVADFIDVHAFGYHWPAFNVADSAITVGAILLILDSLFSGRSSARN